MAAYAQPRGPVERSKSGTLDFPDGYQSKMLRWKQDLTQQANDELQAYQDFQDVERFIRLLDGKGWWGDILRPPWRSTYYDNHLADSRVETISSLTDIRPTIDISSKVAAYKPQAAIGDKYIRYLWDEQDLDLKVGRWVDHALFGSGILKCVAYDPGIFDFSARGLDTVTPVFMNEDIQDAAAVIDSSYQILSYFQAKFGEKADGLERYANVLGRPGGGETYARPSHIPEYTWNSMSPGMKRLKSRQSGPRPQDAQGRVPYPIIALQEIYSDDWSVNEFKHDVLVKNPDLGVDEHNYHYIVPPRGRLYPRKRLVIFGGDRPLYDGPSPFWHGLYPYVLLQLNPAIWTPGGISKYRDLVPLVKSSNRIGAGIDEAVMRALNGIWVARRGSISDVAWDAFHPGKPAQKVLLNPTAQPNDFREIASPPLPPQVEMWARYLVDAIKRRSGQLDIQELSKKRQVPGGDTLAQMSDAKSNTHRREGRFVEASLRQAGYQTLSNIFQFARIEQRLKVLGGDGITYQDFDYDPGQMVPASSPKEDHWKLFSIRIAPGSLHDNKRFEKKQEAFLMHMRGALSTEGLYEQTEFPATWDVEKKRLAQEHQSGVGAPPAAKGRQPRVTRAARTGGGGQGV